VTKKEMAVSIAAKSGILPVRALEIIRSATSRAEWMLPANWWITGSASLLLLLFLRVQTWRLYRPE
jgi:hypothetical protein